MSTTTTTVRASAPDPTCDPALRSWVESANDAACDFPIQNLPLGLFRRARTREQPRIGVAIGNQVLDVPSCIEHHLLDGISKETACALCATTLNQYLAQGRAAWRSVRASVSSVLADGSSRLRDAPKLQLQCLLAMEDAEMQLPATIGDYTDFYASIHHATNVGKMMRPDNPLLPNYKHLPVGYNGRSSSIVPGGTPVRRPCGQVQAEGKDVPVFAPSRLLDYEIEMGVFIGPGNELGQRIPMAEALDHVFGMVIVNDWSARDVQKWEYQPLGPFMAKDFATSISPWVVTLEALAPYRMPGPRREPGDPPMLDYLKPTEDACYDVTVEVYLATREMRWRGTQPALVSRGHLSEMYWTFAQMLVHHTSTGCNLKPGDLIASGTISGAAEDSRGCLLERTWRGQTPLQLPDGSRRSFLEDGDEVIMRAYCQKPGAPRIGFGECRGVILPAA